MHGHRGVSYQPRFESVHRDVGNMLDSGDVVMSLGAGNIHEQLALLAADLVIAEKLRSIVGEQGDVRLYEPLSKHTSCGRPSAILRWVQRKRICRIDSTGAKIFPFVVGHDSNLYGDGGIRGVVVRPCGWISTRSVNGNEITALGETRGFAYAGKAAGLGRLEWMEGIRARSAVVCA
jgi:hypothetical protein